MKIVTSAVLILGLLSGIAQAQSCNDSIDTSTPDIRFEVSDDEVTDVRTNLIWKRCAEGQVWVSASSSCSGSALSLTWSQALSQGSGDWRLPNIKELLSIVEVSCASPAINETIFPDTSTDGFFWTSSPYINNAQAWSVLFDDGNDAGEGKSSGGAVRLVKSQ